jgi:hypothetical protein
MFLQLHSILTATLLFPKSRSNVQYCVGSSGASGRCGPVYRDAKPATIFSRVRPSGIDPPGASFWCARLDVTSPGWPSVCRSRQAALARSLLVSLPLPLDGHFCFCGSWHDLAASVIDLGLSRLQM